VQALVERDCHMKRPPNRISYLTAVFALSSVALFCAPAVFSQIDPMRLPASAGIHGKDVLATDSLEQVQLAPARPPSPASLAETISVNELLISPPAVKEFRRSEKADRSGDYRAAIAHLQKALRIEPKFVQAHNNLGANYLELKDYESAVKEFEKAIELDAKLEEPHRNLGLGLFLLGRYHEAELITREALILSPERNVARYTLGRILAAEGSSSSEAEQLLRRAMPELPEARLPLAQVLLQRCANDAAAAELRAYLATGRNDPPRRQVIETWLARIDAVKATGGCAGAKTAS
jgi:tetratricopeptide (TPR) repeat protein